MQFAIIALLLIFKRDADIVNKVGFSLSSKGVVLEVVGGNLKGRGLKNGLVISDQKLSQSL